MTLPSTISNPFRSSIVSDPWQAPETDVTSVHKVAFEKCCAAVAAIRANRRTTSVLVHGEAGSGKTHLLARLRTHISRGAEVDGPSGLQEAIFVSVRLQTGARMIWRHLRNRFTSDLLRSTADCVSQLERILLHHLSKSGLVDGDGTVWLKQRRKEFAGTNATCVELEELFDQVDAAGRLSHNLRVVLEHLLFARHRGLAGAWLRGESLPESALQRIQITGGQDDEEELEAEAHQIALALSSLATSEMPVIFCFDQVEALQAHPMDTAGLFAFGQMVSALHDQTRNALLISCVQSAFLNILRDGMKTPDYDRLGEFAKVSLTPLTWDEATQLIKARMSMLPELSQLRAQHNGSLWPLREDVVKNVFEYNRCLARKLLAHCADLFDAQRISPALSSVPSIPAFLYRALEERRRKALEESEPSQTEQIVVHGLPSLLNLARQDVKQKERGLPRGVDLLVEGPQEKIAISICNGQHWPSLVRKLDRLNTQLDEKQLGKLVLLRDGRLPIGANAVRTRALREQLIRKGARWVEPSVESLAALDALRRLLADAGSGDLANRGDTVELKTVQDWLVANLSTELKDLLEEILPLDSGVGQITSEDLPLYEDIAGFLQWHHLVSVADIAARLEREEQEVAECAQRYANRIGVLGEPPEVLFRLVSEDLAA